MEVYIVRIKGKPKATREINEIKWIDSSYKKQRIKLASINEKYIVPRLKKEKKHG